MKTVIFDFDGTIADTFVLAKTILNKLAPKYGYGSFDDEDIFDLKQLSMGEIVEKYKISRFDLARMVWSAQREVARNLTDVRLHAGLKDVISQLHAEGYKLAVVSSNSRKNIVRFLTINQVTEIDYVDSSINLFGKASLVKKLLKKHGLAANDAIYVGDEVRDFDTAREAGIKPILVTWGYNSKEVLSKTGADLVDSPTELKRQIDKSFK